uniref:Ribosomal protein L5 n=1 Tax=Coleochaete scutata TaxID=3125 RepID=A0A5P9NW43_COLSC|nr:ribosomal protein L5 [Coleochaete scutata]QFU80145.1 ribosomal protein L5 [Coleochaete scutata]QIQ23005.1 ribosomal protein L5 [Coleochaete scutata]
MKKFVLTSFAPRLLFHYQNVIRPDLLAKCNYTNIMEIPLLCEIQITPYYHAGLEEQGRLAIEILSGRVTTRLKECNEYPRVEGGKKTKIAKAKLIRGDKKTNSTWGSRHHGALASDQNKLSFGFLPIKGRLMYLFLDKIITVLSLNKVHKKKGNLFFFDINESTEVPLIDAKRSFQSQIYDYSLQSTHSLHHKPGDKGITPARQRHGLINIHLNLSELSLLPEIAWHSSIFESISAIHLTIVTSAKSLEETNLLWSGFMQKENSTPYV